MSSNPAEADPAAKGRPVRYLLIAANLSLLVLFPLSWFAPLMRAGLLPFFDLSEISIVSGLQSLWQKDVGLALLVTFFAIFAPYLKTIGLALLQFRLLSPRVAPALHILGKLAMADIFLIALYIILVKGIGLARVETAWGLYMFTGCVLASLALSIIAGRKNSAQAPAN
ncbi:paraquat-inducible protein A (plasmid) [Pseudorhodobacter turbinis]|uniref:Paraquat-inducible protein A n=1 Tax=Pseudorhodobacter turbinis TaxID=2500533 RepID=A0A4P8EIV9_9RHOB|nr:paraquat-inducible protein A [Pseudorhodobacter turbinis]QCO56869.1 paraquat-inducible protein A [Pseudorhodobacter turbinis]